MGCQPAIQDYTIARPDDQRDLHRDSRRKCVNGFTSTGNSRLQHAIIKWSGNAMARLSLRSLRDIIRVVEIETTEEQRSAVERRRASDVDTLYV
jgi:hypothetical protein